LLLIYFKIKKIYVLYILKKISIDWWNFHHTTHHAKPNVINKDADLVGLTGHKSDSWSWTNFFVLGNTLPKEV
jgi:hypothetical protein